MAHEQIPEPDAAQPSRWLSAPGFSACLLAGLVICFPGVVGGWEAFFYRDHGVLAYPSLFHLRASLAEGAFPLWNPLSNCGAPFAAQWGPMAYYPPLWLFLILPLPQGLGWFCLAHLLLAGLGMYFLARRWTGHAAAACLAGWWYVFNGATFSCIMWPNYLVALGWMPWVVWGAEAAWLKGGRSTLIAGGIAALQLLSGVPELIALTWLLILALAVLAIFEGPGLGVAIGRRLAGVIVLAAGLAAVQLLPFFELLFQSHRAAGGILTKWTMPPWGLANFILPLFHCFETPEGIFYQHGQNFLTSYYPGVLAVVLAGWALLWGRTRRVVVLAVLAAAGCWLAMGDAAGLYAALKWLFPPLEVLRFPVKFVLLTAFLLPLLAAHGLAGQLRTPPALKSVWLTRAMVSLILVAGLLLILVAVAFKHPLTYDQPDVTRANAWLRLLWLAAGLGALLLWHHPRLSRVVIPALLIVGLADLLTHAPRQNPTLPVRLADFPVGLFAPGFWQISQKSDAPRHGEGRIFITAEAEQALLHSSSGDLRERWFERRTAQWSHLNLLDRIPKVNGSSTLQIRAQREVEDQFYKVHTNRPPAPMLDFLGVTAITAPGMVNAFVRRTNALPLITAGQQAVFVPQAQVLNHIFRDDFNPQTTVCFAEELRAQVTVTQAAPAKIHWQKFAAHRAEGEVDTPAPALVVIAQSHYPAWRARVNGQTVPLWPANHAFQALAVPAGKHRVEVVYHDRWFFRGLALSLLTLAAMVFLWVRTRPDEPVAAG